MFVNASDALAVLQIQNIAPAEAIEAVLIRRDVGTRDKAAFALLNASFLEDAAVRTPARWGGSIALGQRTSLYIPLRVGPLSLEPGFYLIRATGLRLSCEAPCTVVDHSGVFTFEVRSTERLPERLDQLCRRAVRAVEDDRAEIAEEHLRRLLVEYPDSSVAFQVRGQLAERQGRWLDAAENYDRAAQLVESGRDKLRIEKDGGPVVSGSLRAFAAKARERGRRE